MGWKMIRIMFVMFSLGIIFFPSSLHPFIQNGSALHQMDARSIWTLVNARIVYGKRMKNLRSSQNSIKPLLRNQSNLFQHQNLIQRGVSGDVLLHLAMTICCPMDVFGERKFDGVINIYCWDNGGCWVRTIPRTEMGIWFSFITLFVFCPLWDLPTGDIRGTKRV